MIGDTAPPRPAAWDMRTGTAVCFVLEDLAVLNMDDPMGTVGNIGFMRHDDDRTSLIVQFLQKVENGRT